MYRVHMMFHLPERTPELGLLHLFSWRVNGTCVFQELGLPRLLCTTKLVGFAPGAVAAPAIFFSVWTESGGCPSNLCKHPVNFGARFCRARFFLHLVPHMQYFVFNVLHYVRKWTSSVHWIEHATSIHVHVASYCHDQCYTVITGRKSKCRRQWPNWKIQAWQVKIVDGHGPSERKIYFWKFGRGKK